MNQFNSIILEGNVEGFDFNKDVMVMDFEISVERSWKNADGSKKTEVSTFDCNCFGSMAEACDKNFKLGMRVRVVGRLRQQKWESDGVKHSKVVVICEHVEMKR